MNEISRNIFAMYLGARKQSRWKVSLYSKSQCEKKKDEWSQGKATKQGDECPHQGHINKLNIDLRSYRQSKNEDVSKMLKKVLEDRCGRKQQQVCIRPIKIIKFKKSVIKSSSGIDMLELKAIFLNNLSILFIMSREDL